MINDLKNITQILKDDDYKNIAKLVVQYQNFKTKVAIQHFPCNVSEGTKQNYLNLGIVYIKTKVRSKAIPQKIYDFIDEFIENHLQPLVPKDEDKRRTINKIYHKKDAVLPAQNLIKELKAKSASMIAKFEYGVRIDDMVKICTSREEAITFMQGAKFAGNKNVQVVSIEKLDLKGEQNG